MPAQTFEIFLDGIVIGRAVDAYPEFPWIAGKFEPAPAFELVRSLFEEEVRVRKTGDDASYRKVRDEFIRRGIHVEPPVPHRSSLSPLVHIDGTTVSWR